MQLSMNPGPHASPGISEAELLQELAILLYQREKLSLGRAAELAGMKKMDFNHLLAVRGIPMHYDLKDLERDLATLRDLASR
jgi:predicted HTH domain antitoxin